MEWKKVVGVDNYEVSDTGIVRIIKASGYKKAGDLISQCNVSGYKCVMLVIDGKQKMFKVHRLVAQAFLPAPENDNQNQVAHADGSRDNNNVSNLRWSTCKENLGDRNLHGTNPDGRRNGRVKLTESQVFEIRKRYVPRSKENGAAALAKEFGVSDVAIIKAFRGETWPLLQGPAE